MSSNKDKVYWQILNAALELDCKKGHLKWTLTELSKKAKVTRSLIYYYFGRSKATILTEAVKLIGSEFIGLSKERMELWRTGRLKESMLRTREFVDRMPYLCNFIMDHRTSQSEIGLTVGRMEKRFIKKLADFNTHLDKDEINALFAIYWGMCFAPNVRPRAMIKCINLVNSFIKGKDFSD
ncbi:MAG: TetR/AcrR family transcriptional regulator [Bdellovibrionaceae bacterium]|jgi:AcrR family transcriptional regulator|nr:TetR/AcrR family transcriptional regulator [Pseudobdellovibrionaceae bacterium]